jgi:hypothetical protein
VVLASYIPSDGDTVERNLRGPEEAIDGRAQRNLNVVGFSGDFPRAIDLWWRVWSDHLENEGIELERIEVKISAGQ